MVAGLAAFQRFKTDIKFKDRVVDNVDNTNLLLFRADVDFKRKISEDWLGIGMAYNFNERFAIGLTQFSVWHSQDLDLNFKKEIVFNNFPEKVSLSWRSELEYGFSAYSAFITKLGLSYIHDYFSLGLTYTSPLYGTIRKGASYSIEDNRINLADDEFSSYSNRSEVSSLQYKSSSSVGFGADFSIDNTKISFATEYFFDLEEYTIFEDTDDSFEGLAANESLTEISIKTNNSSVLNLAVGFQHSISPKTTWYGGFRTDKDQNNSILLNNNNEYLGSVGDIYHISGGCTFTIGKNKISLGTDLGYGRNSGGQQLVDLSNITPENLFTFGDKNNVSSRYYSIMLFITYDFIFAGFTENDE